MAVKGRIGEAARARDEAIFRLISGSPFVEASRRYSGGMNSSQAVFGMLSPPDLMEGFRKTSVTLANSQHPLFHCSRQRMETRHRSLRRKIDGRPGVALGAREVHSAIGITW